MKKFTKRRRNQSLPDNSMIVAAAEKLPNELVCSAGEPVDIVAAAGEDKLPTFSMTAYTGGILNLPNFYHPVVADLQGMSVPSQRIPVDRHHDVTQIVGHSESIQVSAQRIKIDGIVSGVGEAAQEVRAVAKNGFPWQASIVASIQSIERVEAGTSVKVNGRNFQGPLIVARKTTLRAVSFVPLGADAGITSATIAASLLEQTDMNFDAWLKAKSIDPTNLSAEVTAVLKAQYDNEIKAAGTAVADEDPPTLAEVKQLIASAGNAGGAKSEIDQLRAELAEDKRRVAIDKLAVQYKADEELSAKAVSSNWSLEKTEVEFLRASRGSAPAIHVAGGGTVTQEVIEAAFCRQENLKTLEKRFKPETLDAVDRHFPRGASLKQVMLEAAWAGGYDGRHFPNSHPGIESLLRCAFQPQIRAGFSTLSLPGIFANTANKFLLEGFSFVEQTYKSISRVRSVNDFKAVTSYRMLDGGDFLEVGATGELKHGTLSEESFSNQAKTYGRMMSVTRQDIINDDLGALTQIPSMLGRKSGEKVNTVFWTAFNANTSFFADPSQHYLKGSTSTLTATGLDLASKKWDAKTDDGSTSIANGGRPLGAEPRILLVGPALWYAARQLMAATTFNSGGAATTEQIPSQNLWAGAYIPLKSRYITATDTEWYLLCDPADIAVIEVCYLNGQQNPTIESADADFNVLGVQMRGYFDFGVTKQDARGGLKVKGAA